MKKENNFLEKSSKRLRHALDINEMKQQELADKSGVSKNSISQYLNKRSIPSNISAGKMAKALGVNPMWLMGYDVPMIKENSDSGTKFDNVFPIEIHKYPLLGEVACGEPILMSEERENYIMSGTDIKADFCLIAKGDSMIPNICDGDTVIVRWQDDAENGETVIATVNGSDATCKRLRKHKDGIELIANNPNYEPMY